MHSYKDLLEQRTALKAEKERLFKLIGKMKDIEEINKQINKLSIEIRSLKPETNNSWFTNIEYVKKPPIAQVNYKTFCEFYKDYIINHINNELDLIKAPVSVIETLKQTIWNQEFSIIEHNYNIYCNEIKSSNQ